MKISEIPAFRILVLIAIGLAIAILLEANSINDLYIFYLSLGLFFAALLCILIKYKLPSLALLSISAGIVIYLNANVDKIETPSVFVPEQPFLFHGKVQKVLSRNQYSSRYIAIGNIDAKSLPLIKDKGILLTVTNSKNKQIKLYPGYEIMCEGKIRLPYPKILPTDFPEDQYAKSLDVDFIAKSYANQTAIISAERSISYWREISVEAIEKALKRLFTPETKYIMLALITGDKSKIPAEVKKDFSATGTAHVIAVSGLHVGIISGIIYLLLGFIQNRWIRLIVFTILIAAFIILSGMQASGIRAGIMAFLYFFMRNLERRTNLLNILSVVVIASIIIFPQLIFSAGFQMSVGSILGIALFYNPFKRLIEQSFGKSEGFKDYLYSSASLTLSASITVSPIVAYYFDIYSFISIPANMLVIPLMSLALIWGIAALLTSFLPIIPTLLATSSSFAIKASTTINRIAADFPGSNYSGELSLLISIVLSASLVYILLSRNSKVMLFRLSVSIAITGLSLFIFNSVEPEITQYKIPTQYSASIIIERKDEIDLIIADRKFQKRIPLEYSIYRYLISKDMRIRIFSCGDAGRRIFNKINRTELVSIYDISHEQLDKITNSIGITNLSKLIEYE